jgi:hypothetical protein
MTLEKLVEGHQMGALASITHKLLSYLPPPKLEPKS